uniref:Uncharacterized protein n=2 Tax=Arion vulgaris TaxID=1028688 RepID=A0A0B7A735_9EUPU
MIYATSVQGVMRDRTTVTMCQPDKKSAMMFHNESTQILSPHHHIRNSSVDVLRAKMTCVLTSRTHSPILLTRLTKCDVNTVLVQCPQCLTTNTKVHI